MTVKIFRKIFGSKNERELRRMHKVVKKINDLEEGIQALSDAELREKTDEFRERLDRGESLDDLLPEAFAVVREAASRTLGLRHFDVQLIGGMTLHEGKIAEMRTGEGKTLVATLAAYLNALTGGGVHLITVNDYLARRDAQWMGPVYHALGLSVGVIQSYAGSGVANSFVYDPDSEDQREGYQNLRPAGRREAYAADITYGTNNEYGFDYLRDNMALSLDEKTQRSLAFAIVDEVDSILIDEARTPLIISGAAQDSSSLYITINRMVKALERRQFESAPRNEKIEASKVLLKASENAEPELMPNRQAMTLADEKGLHLVQVAMDKLPVCQLLPSGDFILDEKTRSVELTEEGHQKVERLLVKEGLLDSDDSLYQAANLNLLHHVHSAIRAQHLFHRDVEYILQDDDVVLIDEHTGRTMPGRRLSEGLHQAIEAKEGVRIQQESRTLASTTFQNYFRLYDKLSGMTGTADTEAYEFHQIYGLTVVVIPTNVAVRRDDLNDLIFLTQEEKFEAVIADIKSCIGKDAPVLVGTASIETSELLSSLLKKEGIKHQVLNAKFHEKEAHIISQAGRPGVVTIATNMAGRGTDIVLGGNWAVELAALKNPSETEIARIKQAWQERHDKVIAADGLHILGTERHESRRIDNQLRGRAGRQGDPGVSRFYLSLEDPLMRLFASDRVKNMMRAMGMAHGEAIEHRMVSNAIEKAQRKVEGRNFDIRKQLLEYDDVANEQRQIIYQQRNELLEADDISDVITNIRHDVLQSQIDRFIPPQSLEEQWDVSGLENFIAMEYGVSMPVQKMLDDDERLNEQGLREQIIALIGQTYEYKFKDIQVDMRLIEKQVMLQVLDNLWKDHLSSMDYLRQGIGLRAYGQRNPKQEYKKESFLLFEQLLDNVKEETIHFLSRLKVKSDRDAEEMERHQREVQASQRMQFQHDQASAIAEKGASVPEQVQPYVREGEKIGRNQPCPCGSGKKYKHCHGQLA